MATQAAHNERERCKKVKEQCIDKCSDELDSGDYSGDPFFKCKRECLEKENCWGTSG
jgi:hypothetical protein